MATEKKIEKSPAEKALLARRIFCIVLAVFGAFVCWFGINAWQNADTIAAAIPAEAAIDTTKIVSELQIFGILLALSGVFKIAIAAFSVLQHGKKYVLPILAGLNLAIVVVALTVLGGVNAGFLWTGIVDIVLSIAAAVLIFDKLMRYLREMIGELKKLTWLSGKELFSHTLAVVTFVVVMAAVIYLLDTTFSAGFKLIDKINIG